MANQEGDVMSKNEIGKPSDLLIIRNGLGLTQEEMGRLIGVTFSSISRWERSDMVSVPTWQLSMYRCFSGALDKRDDLNLLVRHWLARYGSIRTLYRILAIVFEDSTTLL